MKYKQLFLIWLLADLFLALGLVGFAVYEYLTGSGSQDDFWMLLWATGLGIVVSIPSLLVMLLFHAVFTKYAKNVANYRLPYLALIVCINMLYLLIGEFVYDMTPEFNVFYAGSTLAGLLAFYLVNRRIVEKVSIFTEQNKQV